MAIHIIEPAKETLHGHYFRELPPILRIGSGDVVRYRTLDSGWGLLENPNPFDKPLKFPERDREWDPGHALCGPIAIQGAKAGMSLEVHLKTIRTGTWGWSAGGGYPSDLNTRLGLAESPECIMRWSINPDMQTAINQFGQTIRTRPFMGNLGMPPAESGSHSTFPPRFCGGNIDCKELIAGSHIFLPIAVDGGLFSIGDGHAVQGDGEVSGVALECPMELVEAEFYLHPEIQISYPRADTPAGWITFGFHEDLNEAMMIALDGMLGLMGELLGVERKEALTLATLAVDMRITQLVNGVRGVHAILPHDVVDGIKRK